MKNKKVVVVIVVIVIAIVGYFVYTKFLAPQPEEAAAQASEASLEEVYYYSTGEAYVTNVKDSKALSKISVSLALTGEEDQTEFLATNNALIRSCVVDVMRNHTEKELRAVDATELLSGQMLGAIKEALKMEDIVNVCISDFVIQ